MLKKAEQERNDKLSKKEANAQEAETKRVHTRETERAEAEKLKKAITEREVELSKEALGKRLKAGEVKAALKGLGAKKVEGKKDQQLDQLLAKLTSLKLCRRSFMGCEVVKEFEGELFEGKVTDDADGLYHVVTATPSSAIPPSDLLRFAGLRCQSLHASARSYDITLTSYSDVCRYTMMATRKIWTILNSWKFFFFPALA